MFRRFFTGRLNRRTYFLSVIVIEFASYFFIGQFSGSSFLMHIWMYLYLFSNTSISVRRLQDIGFCRLLIFIVVTIQIYRGPIVALSESTLGSIYPWWLMYLIALILVIYPGQSKSNQYGPVPGSKIELEKLFGEFNQNRRKLY